MIKSKPNPRILEWNVESDVRKTPQSQHVLVLLLNESREINRIKERIVEATRPIGDLMIRATGVSKVDSSLRYECFTFDTATAPNDIPWTKIYGGRKSRNRDLYERERSDGLQVYVDQRMS